MLHSDFVLKSLDLRQWIYLCGINSKYITNTVTTVLN